MYLIKSNILKFLSVSLIWAILALLSPTLLLAQGRSQPIVVDEVSELTSVGLRSILGSIVALNRAVISAAVSGPVIAIPVRIGNHVKQGSILARFDQEQIKRTIALRQAEVQQSKASLLIAEARVKESDANFAQGQAGLESAKARRLSGKANLDLARAELRRAKELQNTVAFSASKLENLTINVELEQAVMQQMSADITQSESGIEKNKAEKTRMQAEIIRAKADLLQSEAQLKLASLDLERTDLKSPFDGIVIERHVDQGGYVRPGDPVLSVIEKDAFEVEALVPADLAFYLEEGQLIQGRLADDPNARDIVFILRAILPEEEVSSRARRMRFKFKDQQTLVDLPLAVNQTVALNLPLSRNDESISVHKDAIIYRAGTTIVFTVDQEGKAKVNPVVLGSAIGDRRIVHSGLALKDQAIIRGNERIRPGQAVNITNNNQ